MKKTERKKDREKEADRQRQKERERDLTMRSKREVSSVPVFREKQL